MIEESDRNETKNEAGAAPEPYVLMKHVENDHSKNKQEFSHGGQKLTSLSNKCQGPHKKQKAQKEILLCFSWLFVVVIYEATARVARAR